MIRYLRYVLRQRIRRQAGLTFLTVAGVAIGTLAVVAIQVLSLSALTAFDATVEVINGDADLVLLGTGGVLSDETFVAALAAEGVATATPILRLSAQTAGDPGTRVDVYGLDLLAPQEVLLSMTADLRPGADLRGASVPEELAERMGWEVGDTVTLASGSTRAPLELRSLIDSDLLPADAGRLFVVMDVAHAQEAFRSVGRLSQVNLRVEDGADAERVAAALSRTLGPDVRIATSAEQKREARSLLAAFRVNLTALSLVSVFVGLFLVYGSTRASLIRRREELGILRCLGATRGQVIALIVTETAILGGAGVLVGIPAGLFAAAVNLESVSRTVSSLYLLSAIERLSVPTWVWTAAIGAGTLGTVLGALGPTVEVAGASTRRLLSEHGLRRGYRRRGDGMWRAGWALAGILLLWFAAVGRLWPHAGLVLAGGSLVWVTLCVPRFVGLVSARVPLRSLGLRFAVRSLGTRLHTTGVAVSGVAIAVSMLVGITVMVASFRDTFESWLGTTVRADVYVSAAGWRADSDQGGIAADVVERIGRVTGVDQMDRLRGFGGFAEGRPVALIAVDFGLADRTDRYDLLQGVDAQAAAAAREGAVLISEPLARRLDLWLGDRIEVTTGRGPEEADVAGVYYDYGTERGTVTMDLSTMTRWFGPGDVHSLAVYLAPGTDPAAGALAVREAAVGNPLTVRTNRSLRENALRIFDQTFRITLLLQGMALLIASAGVALSLLVMSQEESGDIVTYRSLGATRGQIFRLFLGKGVGMAGFGSLLGLVGGAALAAILILVTNRAYFGWTVQLNVPFTQLAAQAVTIGLAAALASWIPAHRAAGRVAGRPEAVEA